MVSGESWRGADIYQGWTKGRELPQQRKCLQSGSAVFGEREDIEIVIEAGCQKASFPHTLRSKDSGLGVIGINGS